MDARVRFLDGLRGFALVLMVVNHTGHWWLPRSMGWNRYHLIYATMSLAAPLFLFLVGFCLPLSARRSAVDSGDRRSGEVARRVARGARIVGAGLLLNVLFFPEDPIWTGGVLQTIGLSLIVMAPMLGALGSTRGRLALVALAVAGYVAFAWSFASLRDGLPRHPLLSQALFFDFPPWPWVALPVLGLVAGAMWLDARRRGPRHEARYFAVLGVSGALAVAAFVIVRMLTAAPPRFGFMHDLMLNRHWTAGGTTLLWVLGMLAAMVAAGWYAMERLGWAPGWLLVCGRAAMMLYFVHHAFVLTLGKHWLGLSFEDWTRYALAVGLLLAGLVGLARGWLALRTTFRMRASAALGLIAARRPSGA